MSMQPGYDLLGLAHPEFPFDRIIKEIPKDTPIGWFWGTFGNSEKRFSQMLNSKFKVFRIQMYYAANHAIVPLKKLQDDLETVQKLVCNKQGITLYISPSCEHAETDKAEVKKRIDLIRKIVPSAIPVQNPWKGKGALISDCLIEFHGDNPGACDLASTDGNCVFDIDAASWVKKYGNRAHPCFLWASRFNLREGDAPPPVPERNAGPNILYFRSVQRLTQPKGVAPITAFKAQKFRAPLIYKTHAEDKMEPDKNAPDDPRANKPVLIITPNVPGVNLIDCHGKTICHFPKYGDYPGGRHRYYSGMPGGPGLHGYEIADKARKQSDCEFAWVKADNKIFGPVHPAFRAGVFRE